jgi:hypothetical protein
MVNVLTHTVLHIRKVVFAAALSQKMQICLCETLVFTHQRAWEFSVFNQSLIDRTLER